MNIEELRADNERLRATNRGLAQQVVNASDRLEKSRRELLAIGWDAGFERGGHLAAWAIGNRPESERPDTDNPYRKPLDLLGLS